MVKKRTLFIFLFLGSSFVIAQTNTWTRHGNLWTGERVFGALVYNSGQNQFLLSMGVAEDEASYSEIMYSKTLGKWINHLPDPSLYTVWADSTGLTIANGRMGSGVFGSPYFIFKNIPYGGTDYLRPNLHHFRGSCTYAQYAHNPDDGKTYYYVNDRTFTYPGLFINLYNFHKKRQYFEKVMDYFLVAQQKRIPLTKGTAYVPQYSIALQVSRIFR